MVTTDPLSNLAAVIINYDDQPSVIAQLEAFYADAPDRFANVSWRVLHNGPDAPPEIPPALRSAGAQIVVESCPNEGYGAAVNRALALSTSPFLLVLNADLLPEAGTLAGIGDLMARIHTVQERVGIVGFQLRNPDGTLQGSAGKPISLRTTLVGLFEKRAQRKYLSLANSGIETVPWITGASFLLSRACVEAIGTFDERFFMYYEDVDFCRRCREMGWRVEYDPSVVFRHFHPYHRRALTHRMVFLARHGLLTYFRKHRPAVEFRMLAFVMRLECWYRRHREPESTGWRDVEKMVMKFQSTGNFVRVTADQLPE